VYVLRLKKIFLVFLCSHTHLQHSLVLHNSQLQIALSQYCGTLTCSRDACSAPLPYLLNSFTQHCLNSNRLNCLSQVLVQVKHVILLALNINNLSWLVLYVGWTFGAPCTPTISPSSPLPREIFNPTHQLEFIQAGLARSLSFFIIFTKSEKTTSMSILFILK
jgi:hypothetical protein